MIAPFLHRIRRKIAHTLAPIIPLGVYQMWMKPNPIGFMYHVVSDDDLPHVKHLYPYKNAAAFERDLIYLKENFRLVGYPDLLAHYRGERLLPPRAAFLTFDDGFAECYTVIFPLLQKHSIPAIFFLATDWVDNKTMYYRSKVSLLIEDRKSKIENLSFQSSSSIFDLKALQQTDEHLINAACEEHNIDIDGYLRDHQPFLTTPQIHEMHAAGHTFGGHTSCHPKLKSLAPQAQQNEIITSAQWVADLVGEDAVPFAFPFSGDGVSRAMLQTLRDAHPHIGLIFDTKKMRRESGILHRIWVDKPVPGVPPQNNLKHWLKGAYAARFQEWAK